MSDSHPPYGGPSDPNAGQPWGQPPGQPVSGQPWGPPPGQPISGQPDPFAYGQPGYQQQPGYPQQQPGYPPPQFATPVQPAKKSRGLMIGLGVGAATVALLALCGVGVGLIVASGDDDPEPPPVATTSAPGGTDPSTAPSTEQTPDDGPNNNNAVTARYSSDFESVCEGSPILNAKDYSTPSGSKAYTFYNSVDRPDNWMLRSAGYGKSYYAKSDEFESVSVVGCLKYQEGSEGAGKKCQLKDSSDKIITIDYVSSRYTLTFYAAKTAQKIGDGGTINAPAVRCPSFVTYNKSTMKAYASPDTGAIESALDKFLG